MNKEQIQQWAREAREYATKNHPPGMNFNVDAFDQKLCTLARADLEAERDAWKQAHDEQVELLNKIASERDELRAAVKSAYPDGEPNWLPTCDEGMLLFTAECALISIAKEKTK